MHLDRSIRALVKALPKLRVTVVPTAASLIVHAALLLLVTAVTITVTTREPRDERQIGEVEIELLGPAEPAAAARSAPPRPTSSQAETPTVEPARTAVDTAERAARSALPATDRVVPKLEPVRTPSARSITPAPAIASRAAATRPAVAFAGLRSRAASRVVYVVDASGAMASSLTFVLDRLATSIERLRPTQQFQVILLGSEEQGHLRRAPGESEGLLRATAEQKADVSNWLDAVRAGGRSNPLEGLREAIALEPEVIFLLSRSIQRSGPSAAWGAGREATLAELDRLNPLDLTTGRRAITIKTIQFIDEDPTGLMSAIGLAHGDGDGSSRVLTLADLGQPDPEPVPEAADPSLEASIGRAAAGLSRVTNDGAALSVLLGVPTDAEVDRIRHEARAIIEVLRDAPPPSPGMSDVRAPLLRARAALLLASAREDPRGNAALAIAELTPLRPLEPEQSAMRRTMLGLAAILTGRGDEAVRLLQDVLADRDDLELQPETIAEIRMALTSAHASRGEDAAAAMLLTALGERPFHNSETGQADPLWRRLAAESRTRSAATLARSAAEQAEPLQAFATDPGIALPAAARRAIAAERLMAHAVREGWSPDDLSQAPADTVLLIAEGLVAAGVADGSAIRWLDAASRRKDDAVVAASALWLAGGLLLDRGEPGQASIRFTRLATEHPGDNRAADATALAVHHATDDARESTLAWAVASRPQHPTADAWRLDLAARWGGRPALELLGAIDPSGPLARDAARLELEFIDTLLETSPHDRTDLLRRAAELGAVAHDDTAPERRLVLAETELPRAPRSALEAAEAVRPDADGVTGGLARVDLLRARALIGLDRAAEAAPILAAIADERESAGLFDQWFWAATTIRLELVADRGDEDARRAARQHVVRLGLIDPDLGGMPWRNRLRALLPPDTTARTAPPGG